MTIEEFRNRLNSGPSIEELKTGFERRIIDIANQAVDKRDDIKKMKNQIADLEAAVENLQAALNARIEKEENEKTQ